ncbi:MAG: single-stranded DNA-binding protein [Erysipelotrichaceae bacterium]|nr:single-stranded DNA-binding protein [Erysipelotrichaceae bacterium]MDY5252686.1 single-stranded DNA-binding protein [Erysipelotrichaceae bacterium]
MLNVFTLVGKVKQMPQIKQTSQGNVVATLIVESERPFRNSDGSITFDLFNITLWKGIAQMCCDCCKEGDVVAIKGRIQDTIYQKDKDHSYHNVELIAEKVSFVS